MGALWGSQTCDVADQTAVLPYQSPFDPHSKIAQILSIRFLRTSFAWLIQEGLHSVFDRQETQPEVEGAASGRLQYIALQPATSLVAMQTACARSRRTLKKTAPLLTYGQKTLAETASTLHSVSNRHVTSANYECHSLPLALQLCRRPGICTVPMDPSVLEKTAPLLRYERRIGECRAVCFR